MFLFTVLGLGTWCRKRGHCLRLEARFLQARLKKDVFGTLEVHETVQRLGERGALCDPDCRMWMWCECECTVQIFSRQRRRFKIWNEWKIVSQFWKSFQTWQLYTKVIQVVQNPDYPSCFSCPNSFGMNRLRTDFSVPEWASAGLGLASLWRMNQSASAACFGNLAMSGTRNGDFSKVRGGKRNCTMSRALTSGILILWTFQFLRSCIDQLFVVLFVVPKGSMTTNYKVATAAGREYQQSQVALKIAKI